MKSLADITHNLAFALLRLGDRMREKKRYEEEMPCTYAWGSTLVLDLALIRPEKLRVVYVSSKKPERYHDDAIKRAEEAGVTVIYDDKAVEERIGRRRYSIVAEIDKWDDAIEPGSHVVLVNPNKYGNVGFIMRSALAFGVHDIAIVSDSFDSFSPAIIRSSMGARLSLRVEVFATIEDYLSRFPQNTLYAFMLDAAKPLGELEKREPFSLVLGNESTGLPPEYTDLCQPVFIEQSREVDSLNLSIAASIALYEMNARGGDLHGSD